MAKFHKLKIKDVRHETEECVSISFDVPADLESEYKYLPGQYLTLKIPANGEELRRSYSICASPHENDLRVAVKRVKDGKGSNFLAGRIHAGDEMEVMTPMGGFHPTLNPTHRKNYILFAGGSGITPMYAIIKAILHEEPESNLILFYGNLNENATIFRDGLNRLAENNKNRLAVHYILEKPDGKTDEMFKGLLLKEKVKMLLEKFTQENGDNEYFICGPTPMMDNVRETLEEKEVEKARIHVEYFTAVLTKPSAATSIPVEKINSVVTVIQYGIETTFDLSSDGAAILDAAIEHGVDAPFACKGAVCATCRGKVVEGKVRMEKNFALTEEEIADGFILTCQSHPWTPILKVDYDT